MVMRVLHGCLGLAVILGLAWLLSVDRKKIRLRPILWGFGLQLGFAGIVLATGPGRAFFQWLGDVVDRFLRFTSYGTEFMFANLVKEEYRQTFGFQFAFTILPTIIFFSSIASIFYHYGVMQRVVKGMAWVMAKTMGTSGAETVSCAANTFLGQTEAPLLVRPYVKDMTRSELATIMVSGFAHISGGVMGGYILMGAPAKHLLCAVVMAAPCALLIAKVVFPELGQPKTAGVLEVPIEKTSANGIDAAAAGAADGLRLALNVGAMLIAFIAIIALLNAVLLKVDGLIDGQLLGGALIEGTREYSGIFPGSLKTIFSHLLYPLAWAMNVPLSDCREFAYLVGTKTSINEFVAYMDMGNAIKAGTLSGRGAMMATYALCGFANFSSIAIQIGGIGGMAPERRADLAKLGLRAMFAGALVSCFTATVAGILVES